MRSSVDYAQAVSAVGHEWIEYETEYFSGKPYKEVALIDPRWREHGADGSNESFNRVARSDPIMSLGEKGNTLLFRRFAHLDRGEGAEEDILRFANQYGYLGVTARQTLGGTTWTGIVNPYEGRSNFVIAETLLDWCREILKMKEAVERFELMVQCRQDDIEGYRKLAARERLERLFYGGYEVQLGSTKRISAGDKAQIKRDFKNHPDILKYSVNNDVESAELAYVTLLINRQIHKRTSLTLAWSLEDAEPKLQHRTTTLIGALWLQFAEYVTQARRLNFCRMCDEPIPIVGRSARSDKDLCSERCRRRASRMGRTVRRSYKTRAAQP